MQYQTFDPAVQSEYPIAFLVPKLSHDDMMREYIEPHLLDTKEVIGYQLHQTGKKTLLAVMKEYLNDLLPVLASLGTKYLLVSDGDYFKALTGVKKADAYLGYVLPNTYGQAYGDFQVVFCPNYRQVFYNPGPVRTKITQTMEALRDHRRGRYTDPGHRIIKFAEYPETVDEIAQWLNNLMEMDVPLSCDIEGYSLKHHSCGIGTISFAWSKHEGISFAVDESSDSLKIREMLKTFFIHFKQKLMYHNISYDGPALIYQLFMTDLLDQKGMLTGMDVILRNWDDTKLISYLATNTCAGNRLGLKDQAQEFAGNYAVEDIKDITKIPLPELLEYNLVDCLSTWYVYEKNHPIMVQDDQLDFYNDMFKPAIWDIIQMQLTGMPLDMDKVAECRMKLNIEREDALVKIQSNMLVREFTETLNHEWVIKKNETLKVKVVSIADAKVVFNPGSSVQKQRLLFEVLGLPVLQLTDNKQPATGHEVLEKLKAYTEDQDEIDLIDVFLDFAAVDKIYTTFIPAMEQAILASDGCHYLFGNFNLGGTVSGRLSSSEPNLQNLPSSGSTPKKKYYAKLIKSCFRAPKGWLFVGLDFSSLEDRISALTTKDSQKLKVYIDGYDGHCLRAFSYFKEKMPGIVDTVGSINSIKDLFPDQRQESKVPTFLLTYQGTHIGMMAKCGFTKIVAMQIEQRYHELYKESDAWVAGKLDEASKVGYITGAFGLRVRTPLLHQVIRGNSSTPYEAEAEGRTAGNALGQSWGLLNTRANAAFMRTVRAGQYRLDIRPISQIHDAGYYLVRDDVDAVEYLNTELVKEVEWQDHPDIEHDVVKLGGELALYHPSWADEIAIKNGASQQDMRDAVAIKVAKLAA